MPKIVPQVYELFSHLMISIETDQFEIVLPPASTNLYFIGDRKILGM